MQMQRRRARPSREIVASTLLAFSAFALFSTACTSDASPPGSSALDAGGGDASDDGSLVDQDGGALVEPDGNLIVPPPGDAGGGPCATATDCPSGYLCMYPLAEACSAHGVCASTVGLSCTGPFCTCRGDTTGACGAYGNQPMEMPLHGPPCAPFVGDGGGDGAPPKDAGPG